MLSPDTTDTTTASSATWNITCNPMDNFIEPLLEESHPLATQVSHVSNTSNESGIMSITTENYNANISGNLPEPVIHGIIEEINDYIREEKEAKAEKERLTCMSVITWLVSGTEQKELADRIHPDMYNDLGRSNYFIGDTKISVAGDGNASFELFKKEVKKNEFNWIEKNIEIISKFFHQGLIQIVLSQLFKPRENMTPAQLFNGNVNAFDNGLNNISFDKVNQEINYRFHENNSITLEIGTRVKYADFSSENGNLLVVSDKEKIVSSTGSTAVSTSHLSLTIGFTLQNNEEFSINKETSNNYTFALMAKGIVNT